MGTNNSKAKGESKGESKGVPDDSPDVVDKTATLPASFKRKEPKEEAKTKTETLPRNLNRSTSFTNSCRNWAKKKGLMKDKGSKTEDIEKEIEAKENGNGTLEIKEISITPSVENAKAVSKLAQKKARAQFFEDMYNSSGISVSSTLTPEKPKRLCDMNLPSPRIGAGSPLVDNKLEGKVETLAKQIEEKERLNKSQDSEVISLNTSIEDEAAKEVVEEKSAVSQEHETAEKQAENIPQNNHETIGEISEHTAALEEAREDLIETTKVEDLKDDDEVAEEEVKGLLKVKDILEASNDQDALDETLPSTARLEPATDTAQHAEDDFAEEMVMETKEQVEDVGEVNEVNEIDGAAVEPSSLESVETDDDEDAKVIENGEEEAKDTAEIVIDNGGDSSEEGGASTDEGYDEEKKGGAEALRKSLKNKTEVDDYEPSASVEDN